MICRMLLPHCFLKEGSELGTTTMTTTMIMVTTIIIPQGTTMTRMMTITTTMTRTMVMMTTATMVIITMVEVMMMIITTIYRLVLPPDVSSWHENDDDDDDDYDDNADENYSLSTDFDLCCFTNEGSDPGTLEVWAEEAEKPSKMVWSATGDAGNQWRVARVNMDTPFPFRVRIVCIDVTTTRV